MKFRFSNLFVFPFLPVLHKNILNKVILFLSFCILLVPSKSFAKDLEDYSEEELILFLDSATIGTTHYFEASHELLLIYENNHNRTKVDSLANQLIKIAGQFNQPTYQATGLNIKSRLAERQGNYDLALSLMLEGLEWSKKGKDKNEIGIILGRIALLNCYADNEATAIKFIEEAISFSKKSDLPIRESVSLYYKGYIYLDFYKKKTKGLKNATSDYQDYLIETKNAFEQAMNIAQSLDNSGLIDAILLEQTELFLQNKQFRKVIDIVSKLKQTKFDSYYYLHDYRLAVAYQGLGKEQLANTHLDSAIQFVSQNGIIDELKDFYELKYDWAFDKKDYQSALHHYKQWEGIKDSLWTAKKQIAFDELNVKYKTETQEQQNLILVNEKENLEVRNKWISLTALLSLLGLISFAFLFLKIRKQNSIIETQSKAMSQSLKEKESLLKEIHHRVKNNLQIISNLMAKQARKTTDSTVKKMMKEGQDRVQSMALIHQNLYQSEHLSSIDIKAYLEELTQNIAQTQRVSGKEITIVLNTDDSKLDIDTAIPIGLILNELITNAYKYAFPERDAGEIKISFQKTTEKGFQLQVKDNGIGISNDINIDKAKSLGLNLVRGLVEQLDGTMKFIGSNQGTQFELVF